MNKKETQKSFKTVTRLSILISAAKSWRSDEDEVMKVLENLLPVRLATAFHVHRHTSGLPMTKAEYESQRDTIAAMDRQQDDN